MITIFNRKELLITRDYNMQVNVRSILSENNISYDMKIVNLKHEGILGSVGENQKNSCIYKLYVHKKDYEEAEYLLRDK